MTIIVALVAVLICISCTEDEGSEISAVDRCRYDNQPRLCTSNLAFIPIYLKDQDSNPIALDHFSVNGDNYYDENIPSETDRNSGRYIIFSDNDAQFIEVGGSKFLFKGMVSDKVIVNETYTVGYNCCHVFLLSENDTVRLNI
ncbi:MAG: hypothetical protein WBA23_00360 [Tunicatimonas sp.]|uniref:hypothetical protein n=1 Tax=Tunicatimonas sp. TaxID=1940096 RepID=UPI003C790C26